MKGQISLSIAITGAIATVFVGAMSAWATASTRVAQVETKIEVVANTQELQYKEVKEGLGRIEKKLDEVLK